MRFGIHTPRVSYMNCIYCQKPAQLVTGKEIYPAHPHLWHKHFWHCKTCKAYVGCHPGSKRPLGELSNAQTRRLRVDAHFALDNLWENGIMTRRQAYKWLMGELQISTEECHIGMFDEEMCRKTIDACLKIMEVVE